MSEPLSDNQQRLMVALRRNEELSTADAGGVRDRHREHLGGDVARKILSRLESRDLVSGEGRGGARRWRLTDAGLGLLDEIAPAGDRDGSPERPYHVLEELSLGALVRARLESLGHTPEDVDQVVGSIYQIDTLLYFRVDTVVAANGAHAYRQVAKRHYKDKPVPTLVAVADRMFKPRKVKVNDDPSVSIT